MTEFVQNVVSICNTEWKFFGQQTKDKNDVLIKNGKKETDEGFWQRVNDYWRIGSQTKINAKFDRAPWSAAFVSFVMREAGAADKFKYDAMHSVYIRKAIKDKLNKIDSKFLGQRIEEYAPKTGDLVGYSREYGISYDYQPPGYQSHCDIVVNVSPGQIEVIGGNVSDSVTKKSLKTNASGLLIDNHYDWFVVIQDLL